MSMLGTRSHFDRRSARSDGPLRLGGGGNSVSSLEAKGCSAVDDKTRTSPQQAPGGPAEQPSVVVESGGVVAEIATIAGCCGNPVSSAKLLSRIAAIPMA